MLVVLAACRDDSYVSYEWNDRRVMCSFAVDDLSPSTSRLLLEDEIQYAADQQRVVLVHAHIPDVTISRAQIEHVLTLADQAGLEYLGYDDLVPGPRRAGIAFAFDDDAVDAWLTIRDQLTAHHARVTFFVTRFEELTDEQRFGLDRLAADGHDIDAHSVNHIHAPDYIRDHGVEAYVNDEVLPSLDVLTARGFHPTSYAYPWGQYTDAANELILQHVARIRLTLGTCPY
jgi:hypothetical protein